MTALEELREKVAARIARSEDVAMAMKGELHNLFGPLQARVIYGIVRCIIEQDRDFVGAIDALIAQEADQ